MFGGDAAGTSAWQASEQVRCADEAVALLRHAFAHGLNRPDVVENLKRDDALRPLWKDKGFQELIAGLLPTGDPFLLDLAFPDDPFTRPPDPRLGPD